MKVLSVVDINPRKLGSFEEYTIALSRRLTSQGGESIVAFAGRPPAELLPYYENAGAILETTPFGPFSRAAAGRLYELIRRHRPDLVHLHFVGLVSFDVILSGLMPGVRLIFSEHDSDVPSDRSALKSFGLRTLRRALFSVVNAAIAPSDYVRERMVRNGTPAGKVRTIHNGVNVERFRGSPASTRLIEPFGLGPRTMLVSSVSKVIPEKGIGVLIEAAAITRDAGADVKYFHVGDGPVLSEYKAKVAALGLENHFFFTGLLNLPDIADLLKCSDVFTLPCTWGEAFSLSILEALAAGKPAVVTAVGGNLEAVTDGANGLTAPPNDPRALAGAILRLYEQPDLRAAMAADSLRRSAYFSVDRWVDETLAEYGRVLGLPAEETAARRQRATVSP